MQDRVLWCHSQIVCVKCVWDKNVYEERKFVKVQRMVRRSKLGQPVMLHAIAYALSTDFAEVPKGLRGLADAIFASQLQSRINEKGNKVLREAGKRGPLSQVALIPIYR